MSIDVKLPDLGDGIKAGDILKVLVREGDAITKDQPIVEIETDKATVEVPSPCAGKVEKILVTTGQTVPVGGSLLTVAATSPATGTTNVVASPPAAAAPTATGSARASGPASTSAAPASAPNTKSGPAAAPHVTPAPTSPAPAAPASTAAARSAPAAPAARSDAATGQVATSAVAPMAQDAAASAPAGDVATAPAGPAIRRLAREVGVDLTHVVGSGPRGRITREDVLEVVRSTHKAANGLAPAAPPAGRGAGATRALPGTPSQDSWGLVHHEPLTKIRQTIAAKMFESWSTVPRVTNFDDADITELEKVRKSSQSDYAAAGIKLTSLPFVVKAVSMALHQHPLLNASIDLENNRIVYKNYVNLGIAVDTDRGLVVPVMRDTDRLAIAEIAREVAQVTEKVRSGSFSVDDLRGGSFTISNLGAIGGTYSTPIVNVPEVAILLVGRARKMPVVRDDQVAIRLMMPLSLSYDHRLVDGAAAARFLNDVIGYLQAPSRLLLAI